MGRYVVKAPRTTYKDQTIVLKESLSTPCLPVHCLSLWGARACTHGISPQVFRSSNKGTSNNVSIGCVPVGQQKRHQVVGLPCELEMGAGVVSGADDGAGVTCAGASELELGAGVGSGADDGAGVTGAGSSGSSAGVRAGIAMVRVTMSAGSGECI